jgi:hypothetical protein
LLHRALHPQLLLPRDPLFGIISLGARAHRAFECQRLSNVRQFMSEQSQAAAGTQIHPPRRGHNLPAGGKGFCTQLCCQCRSVNSDLAQVTAQ